MEIKSNYRWRQRANERASPPPTIVLRHTIEMPAAVITRMLGISLARATCWTRDAGNTRPGYAASLARRTSRRSSPRQSRRRPCTCAWSSTRVIQIESPRSASSSTRPFRWADGGCGRPCGSGTRHSQRCTPWRRYTRWDKGWPSRSHRSSQPSNSATSNSRAHQYPPHTLLLSVVTRTNCNRECNPGVGILELLAKPDSPPICVPAAQGLYPKR